MKKIKYQRLDISLPAGSNPTTEPFKIDLDVSYSRCVGMAYYETKDGGIGHYNIGLKDADYILHDLTHKSDWQPNASERYKSINIKNHKRPFFVQIGFSEVLTQDLVGQMVFVLESDEQA